MNHVTYMKHEILKNEDLFGQVMFTVVHMFKKFIVSQNVFLHNDFPW